VARGVVDSRQALEDLLECWRIEPAIDRLETAIGDVRLIDRLAEPLKGFAIPHPRSGRLAPLVYHPLDCGSFQLRQAAKLAASIALTEQRRRIDHEDVLNQGSDPRTKPNIVVGVLE